MFKWKEVASNAVFLDENTGGKGKYFRARILQAGLVKYSFGVCLLEKDTIDRFIQEFVGCPVIIDHKDVTNENAKDERVGVISRVWFEQDGWYWVEGIIFDEDAISLINDGYNVSCQYEISEYANNVKKELHNGNPYDKVILNGKPEHLAIVKTPRYENAMIAVNALDVTEEKSPNIIIQAINEIKETDMFKNLFKKENKMDKDELKSLFMECLTELTAKNEADEEDKKADNEEDEKVEDEKAKNEEDKKEDDKAENEDDEKEDADKDAGKDAENKCKNEVVDKRDIIRQIMAIAGKEEASEDVKTIAKLAEKLAYDKSEADDKADNKCKNEDEEEDKEKATNSIDELIGKMSAGVNTYKRENAYMTQKKAIELGDKLF